MAALRSEAESREERENGVTVRDSWSDCMEGLVWLGGWLGFEGRTVRDGTARRAVGSGRETMGMRKKAQNGKCIAAQPELVSIITHDQMFVV